MKVIELKAEKFKRLKAVDITPSEDGSAVVLTGRNAQGKSSVLDAIQAALGGRASKIERPIRDGETKASVELTLDDMVVTRTWTRTGSQLTITSRDGKAKFSTPQTILDALVGRLAFDPLAFAESDPKVQKATLLEVAELDFDPIENERLHKQVFEERTNVNRDIKRLRAQLDGLPCPTDPPTERPSAGALADRLRDADAAKIHRDTLLAELRHNGDEIARLTARNHEIVAEGRSITVPTPAEMAEMVDQLARVDEAAKEYDQWQRYVEVKNELAGVDQEANNLSNRLAELNDIKTEGLASAKFPINGLGFDADGVTYKGVPFSQASMAERLLVSTAMAMAMNPDLRVICVRDASVLDPANLALLKQAAADRDYQLWIETVHDTGGPAVVIEDGEVQA